MKLREVVGCSIEEFKDYCRDMGFDISNASSAQAAADFHDNYNNPEYKKYYHLLPVDGVFSVFIGSKIYHYYYDDGIILFYIIEYIAKD